MSCGSPDVDVVAEAADAVGEFAGGAGGIAASKVFGAEIAVAGPVGEHVVGGGEDRCRDGDRRFLGSAPGLQSQELGQKVAVLLARSSQGALHEDRFQPGRGFAKSDRDNIDADEIVDFRKQGPL